MSVDDAIDREVVDSKDKEQSKDITKGGLQPPIQRPVMLENPYTKAQTLPENTKFIDKMAAVLDRLDIEYEEELKNKPKKLIKKTSKKKREPKTSTQKRGSSVKRILLDSFTSTKRTSRESPAT